MDQDAKNSTLYGRFRILAAGAVVVGGLVVPAGNGAAAKTFVTGEEFRVMCTSNWGNPAYLEMYAACRAYVAAVADVLAGGQTVGVHRACFDGEVTKGGATKAVVTWMRKHPERKGLSATQMAAAALAQTYPCS